MVDTLAARNEGRLLRANTRNEVVHKRGFTDPGLTGNKDYLPRPIQYLLKNSVQLCQFLLTAEQPRRSN
jgi:hypothetical protein